MTRSHLVQGFIAEGTAYDLGAALIGAAAGVLVAFGLTAGLDRALGDTLTIAPYATWRSLLVAYALGVSVTFLTIIFASVRSSRLNIVAAIRDLPEETHHERGQRPRWRWWTRLSPAGLGIVARVLVLPLEVVWNVLLVVPKLFVWLLRLLAHLVGWGPLIAAVGCLFTLLGVSATSMFVFSLGLSLVVLGLILLLRNWLPTRLVYTVGAGLMLLYWLLPADVTSPLLPDVGDGGPEMLVVSGIFMVLYSTLIIMWNADLIVGLVALLGRAFASWLPAVKMAVAYPLSSKGRSGMTIAMFSIVVFALVMVATISTNFRELLLTDEAAAGWDIEVTANPSNPIDDLGQSLAETDVNVDEINSIGRVDGISEANSQVRNAGTDTWERYTVNGMDQSYIDNADVELQSIAEGYADVPGLSGASDDEVWQALRSNENVAIIDLRAFERGGGFAGGSDDRYVTPEEIDVDEDTFQPFEIELLNPGTGGTETVTVIGVIDSSVSTLTGFYLPAQVFDDLYEQPDSSRFYVQLDEDANVDSAEYADEIQGALRTSGVEAESIMEQIEESQAFSESFFTLMEGFMGLGLFVGLAALGVISFRAVVERRQQIGMLRAIGYQRGMVAASFMLESLITATLGVLTGAGLALVLAYNLVMGGGMGDEEFTTFVVPGPTIALVIVASLAAAAVMTWIPARKASTVPVSEALRYE
jgi:putative ABC transport system permease protein